MSKLVFLAYEMLFCAGFVSVVLFLLPVPPWTFAIPFGMVFCSFGLWITDSIIERKKDKKRRKKND